MLPAQGGAGAAALDLRVDGLPQVRAGAGLRSVGTSARRTLVLEEKTQVTHYLDRATGTGASVPPEPLTVLRSGVIVAGTIGGVMPTIGGTSLAAGTPPALTIPTSGTRHVMLTVTSTFTVFNSVFVQTATVTAASFALESGAGSSVLLSTSGTFKVRWATFVDGVKTYQHETGDFVVDVIDDRTASARGTIVLL